MAMRENIEIAEMTWTEVDQALKDRPVALLPVGATEAHGPHLPLSTDTLIATEMARRTAVKLKERGITSLIVPAVGFTIADFGAEFAGTISLPPLDGLMASLKKGAKSFTEAGGEDAYFGDPTAASAEEGENHFETLSEILTLSVMEHLGSKA